MTRGIAPREKRSQADGPDAEYTHTHTQFRSAPKAYAPAAPASRPIPKFARPGAARLLTDRGPLPPPCSRYPQLARCTYPTRASEAWHDDAKRCNTKPLGIEARAVIEWASSAAASEPRPPPIHEGSRPARLPERHVRRARKRHPADPAAETSQSCCPPKQYTIPEKRRHMSDKNNAGNARQACQGSVLSSPRASMRPPNVKQKPTHVRKCSMTGQKLSELNMAALAPTAARRQRMDAQLSRPPPGGRLWFDPGASAATGAGTQRHCAGCEATTPRVNAP